MKCWLQENVNLLCKNMIRYWVQKILYSKYTELHKSYFFFLWHVLRIISSTNFNAQFSLFINSMFVNAIILDMFRALTCPSSGGKLCIKVGWWNNSILWCTVEKNIKYFTKFNQPFEVWTEAIPLCDIISIYIFTSYTTIIKLTLLSATT